MAEGAAAHLTAKERILLHLSEHARFSDSLDVPRGMTQEGIARGALIEERHVPQYVRPLIKEGLVRERMAHVRGSRQRRKVYDLTASGRLTAVRLRKQLEAETAETRDGNSVRTQSMAQVMEASRGKTTWAGIGAVASRGEVIDPSVLVAGRPGVAGEWAPNSPEAFVAMLRDAPQIDNFVGRKRELALITEGSEGPRFIVVRGVAGIGKSSLAAKACESLRGRRNLYWHRVRPWDTAASLFAGLGGFLSALGRPGLQAVLRRGEAGRVAEVLKEGLSGTQSFLVFDDVHEASREVLSAFRLLMEIVADAAGVRALVLTRRRLGFYDRRDVSMRKSVLEIDLGGLDPSSVTTLLASERRRPELAKLARRYGGHPLAIELLRTSGATSMEKSPATRVNEYLEEQVYHDLTEPERRMMKLASLYRAPVPPAALYYGPQMTHGVLHSLRERALVRAVGDEAFEVHDAIREYFGSVLTPDERVDLGNFATNQLRALATDAAMKGNHLASVDYLSNAIALAASPEARNMLFEALGDAYQFLGDLPETLTAYKEGLDWTKDRERIARLHRKASWSLMTRGQTDSASAEIAKGVQALGDARSVERAWLELYRAYVAAMRPGNEQRVVDVHPALEVFREFGERRGEVEAVLFLGLILVSGPTYDLDKAERYLQEGLRLASSLGDRELRCIAHNHLANFYAFRRPDVERALTHLAKSEDEARDQDHLMRSDVLWWKARFQMDILADFDLAEATLTDYLALSRRIYDPYGCLHAYDGFARIAYYRGNVVRARSANKAVWREGRAMGGMDFPTFLPALWLSCACCLLEGDYLAFERMVGDLDAEDVMGQLSERMVVVHSLRGLAAFLRGDEAGFESSFARGLKVADQAQARKEDPFEFLTFLVSYAYGIALRARGFEDAGVAHVSRAMQVLRTYSMKAWQGSLARDQDGLLKSLRDRSPLAVVHP